MRDWRRLFGNSRLHFEIVQLQLHRSDATCSCMPLLCHDGVDDVGSNPLVDGVLQHSLPAELDSFLQLPHMSSVTCLSICRPTYAPAGKPSHAGLNHWPLVREAQRRVRFTLPLGRCAY